MLGAEEYLGVSKVHDLRIVPVHVAFLVLIVVLDFFHLESGDVAFVGLIAVRVGVDDVDGFLYVLIVHYGVEDVLYVVAALFFSVVDFFVVVVADAIFVADNVAVADAVAVEVIAGVQPRPRPTSARRSNDRWAVKGAVWT